MSLAKVLLLFFITTMHITSVVSLPLDYRRKFGTVLCNLQMAENNCIQLLFRNFSTTYSNDTLEPLDGITFPVGNNDSVIQESMSAIHHYLQCLPNLVVGPTQKTSVIISNTTKFNNYFENMAKKKYPNRHDDPKGCHLQEPPGDYAKRDLVFRMIYFSRKWTEEFLNVTSSCT